MANTKQSEKRARQNEKNRQHNMPFRTEMRTYLKRVVKQVAEGQKSEAVDTYKKATAMVDKLATKGLIHKNKAARHKSRLSVLLKKNDCPVQAAAK